jgi:hypothetical protein
MGQNASTFGYALNTVAAIEDFIADGGLIYLKGVGTFPWDHTQTRVAKSVYVAAVGRSTTLTFTAPTAIGEEYNIFIQQAGVGGGAGSTQVITVIATNTSATTIAQAFKSAFDGLVSNGILYGTSSGGADAITIVGTSAYPMLVVTGKSSTIALAVNVVGNPEQNSGAQLLEMGVENAVVGTNYTVFTFQNVSTSGLVVVGDDTFRGLIYAVSESATNASGFIAGMTAVLSGGVSAASPNLANPDLIGKL